MNGRTKENSLKKGQGKSVQSKKMQSKFWTEEDK